MRQYEDWLNKQAQYLDSQVKVLETQIQKQKRAKKTIQARQRQVRFFFLFSFLSCTIFVTLHKVY